MALVLANRVQETTTTTGTGTVTLAGAMSGFQSFAVVGNTNTTYYAITSGTAWEVGIGTYSTTGPTLARTTILSSSIGGGAITLAGTSIVFATYPSEKSVNYDASSNVGIGTTSPNNKLQINGANIGIRISDTSGTTDFHEIQSGGVNGQNLFIDADRNNVGSGNMIFRVAGATERMRIDGSGNVGIGTSSPVRPLHAFYNSSVVGAYTAVLQGAGGGYGAGVSFQSVLTGGALAEMARITADGEAAWDTTAANQDAGLRFYTALNGTVAEKMRLNSDGNVGIGTSSPGQKLEVNGITKINTASATWEILQLVNTQASSGAYMQMVGAPGGTVSIGADATTASTMIFRTAGTERMRITSAGLVGIGTTAGGGFVNIRETDTNFEINTTGTSADLLAYNRTTSAYKQLNFRGSEFLFKVNDIEKMRIDSSGNVGIGTTPVQQNGKTLQVDGAAGPADFRLTNNATGAGYNNGGLYSLIGVDNYLWNLEAGFLSFGTSNAERMRIDSSGNVGIGTTGPGYRLDVAAADTTAGIGYAARLRSNATATAAGLQFTNSAVTTENGVIYCSDAGLITVQGSSAMAFRTNGNEQFRILSTGGITSASLADAVGYKGLPQNSQTASYTLALTDMGKMVNTTTGGVVIPANASVAFPIGSTVVVYNNSASSQTISITTDTIYLAGTATTGSRTLAQRGLATCVKVASTTWVVSGNVT